MEAPPSAPSGGGGIETLFEKVRRLGTSALDNHIQVHAVLEAATEVIKQNGGPQNSTSYLGVLITLLNERKDQSSEELAAIMCLISMVFPLVPPTVIKMKGIQVAQTLLQLLEKHRDSPAIVKYVLNCLPSILVRHSTWDAAALTIFQTILQFSLDHRPKVRKASHTAITTVLQESSGSLVKHYSVPVQELLSKTLTAAAAEQPEQLQAALHTLGLLKTIFPRLPAALAVSTAEAVLALAGQGQPVLRLQCFQALEALVGTSLDADSQQQPRAVVTAPLLNQLLAVLLEHPPNAADAGSLTAYATLVTSATLRLHGMDVELCYKMLPGVFGALITNFLSDNTEVVRVTTDSLKTLIAQCIDTRLVQETHSTVGSRKTTSALENVLSTLEGGLRYPYRANWPAVIQLLGIAFRHLGAAAHPLMNSTLLMLSELHETKGFTLRAEVAAVLGIAIGAMGPQRFLDVLPLNLEREAMLQRLPLRAWMLPIMREHIRNAPLAHFMQYVVPLADDMKQRATEADAVGTGPKKAEAMEWRIVYIQLWALFTAYAVMPTDCATVFKTAAKTIGTRLEAESLLHESIATGLAVMIENFVHVSNDPQQRPADIQMAKQSVASIALFSKNFLPVLFNVFSGTAIENRPAIHRAITAYISITERGFMNNFFKNVVSKLLAISSENKADSMQTDEQAKKSVASNKQFLTELTMAFVRQLDDANCQTLFRVLKPQFSDPDGTLQKKSFKVLLSICEHQPAFVNAHLDEVTEVILNTLLACTAAAKKARLRCLRQLIAVVPAVDLPKLTLAVLTDVMLCVKEVALKCRQEAFRIIVAIGQRFLETQQPLEQYFTMLVAGLAGTTPHMMASAVLAISRAIFQFKELLRPEFLHELVENVLLLLEWQSRELVRAVLGFAKVVIICLTPEFIHQHLNTLMKGLLKWADDPRNHFRQKIKVILERLVKKYGYDNILGMMPEGQRKILVSLRRQKKRAEKKKQQRREQGEEPKKKHKRTEIEEGYDAALYGSESESDDRDEHDAAEGDNKRTRDGDGTFILEGSDEPLDILDRSAAQSLSSNPQSLKVRRKARGDFPVNEDGKLLIGEEDDEAAPAGKSKGKRSCDHQQARDDYADEDGAGHSSDDEAQANSQGKRVRQSAGNVAKKKRSGAEDEFKHTGKEYQAKKAGGDVKRSSQKLEPFAYVPLNRRNLNKRRKSKALNQFKNVVKAAQSGAQVKVKKRK